MIGQELGKMVQDDSAMLTDGYRLTELGPLPEAWQVVRLGEVAEIGPARIPRENRNLIPFIPMAIIPENGVCISHWEMKSSEEIRSGIFIAEGDLLLAKITPCLENGKQGIVTDIPGGWGYASTEVFPIRSKGGILTEYLALYLLQKEVRQNLASKMEGTTGRQRLPKPVVVSLPIPLPPLAEQRAIAHVLRTVQRAQEASERVIAALKELKKSLMRHLFTYGPVPVSVGTQDTVGTQDAVGAQRAVPLLQDTEIGPLPAHWQVVRLGEVCEKSPQVVPAKMPNWQFKYVDVSCVDNSSLNIVDYQVLTGKEAPSRARKLIKTGDTIFATVRPYLKRIALVPPSLDGQICSTAFCVLSPKPEVDGSYLFYAVSRDEFVTSVAEYQRGSSYPAITDNDVLRGLIPLPPLPEQHAIARMLQAVDRRIEAEEASVRALEALFKTLLHELMTAKRRLPQEFIARF
ncbi:MAG: restriction endonuclease subunit S [Ardenticatenia bacterium]|jgi:type I restriction enzyme S subunit|nr:MAG: restriction endonuclease subunit S [Ardenticatenia bacterium]